MTYEERVEKILADLRVLKADISADHLGLRTSGVPSVSIEDLKKMLDVLFMRVKHIEDDVVAANAAVKDALEEKGAESLYDLVALMLEDDSRIEELEDKVHDLECELEEEDEPVNFDFRTGGG